METDFFKSQISKTMIAINVLITGAFFALMSWLLMPFVPSFDPFWQVVVGMFTATSIAGPFFIALFMFELVLVENLRAKKVGRNG